MDFVMTPIGEIHSPFTDPAHTPIAFPSPRSWEYAHRALQKFDKTDLLADALMALCGGRTPPYSCRCPWIP